MMLQITVLPTGLFKMQMMNFGNVTVIWTISVNYDIAVSVKKASVYRLEQPNHSLCASFRSTWVVTIETEPELIRAPSLSRGSLLFLVFVFSCFISFPPAGVQKWDSSVYVWINITDFNHGANAVFIDTFILLESKCVQSKVIFVGDLYYMFILVYVSCVILHYTVNSQQCDWCERDFIILYI